MNDMRKIMDIVEEVTPRDELKEFASNYGVAYAAAYVYINSGAKYPKFGRTKPHLANELSETLGIDKEVALLMIDAIDAYEDIRDAEEFKVG